MSYYVDCEGIVNRVPEPGDLRWLHLYHEDSGKVEKTLEVWVYNFQYCEYEWIPVPIAVS